MEMKKPTKNNENVGKYDLEEYNEFTLLNPVLQESAQGGLFNRVKTNIKLRTGFLPVLIVVNKFKAKALSAEPQLKSLSF